MYGTVARLQVKPGSVDAIKMWGNKAGDRRIPGHITSYVYQMDNNPNEFYLAVVFADKASYVANAQNPAQHESYLEMRSLLTADPEWHDGEIVFAGEAVARGL